MRFLIIFLILFLGSCEKQQSKNNSNKDIVDNKIKIGMTREDLIALLGDPDKREVNMYPMGTVEQLFYEPQYTIYVSKGKITKVQGSAVFDQKQEKDNFDKLVKKISKFRSEGKTDEDIEKYFSDSFLSVVYNKEMVKRALSEN